MQESREYEEATSLSDACKNVRLFVPGGLASAELMRFPIGCRRHLQLLGEDA